MGLLAILLVYIALPLATLYYLASLRRPANYPPGPIRWPILGKLPWLIFSRSFGTRYFQWAKTYGPLYSVKVGEWDQVVLSDYSIAKDALSQEEWADRPQWKFFHFYMKYANAGILFANGRHWKTRRRFALKNLRDFGFGRSSMESLILDEFKVLADLMSPSKAGHPDAAFHDLELDESLNAAVTNVIWWLMANKKVAKGDEDFERLLDTINTSLIPFDVSKLFSYFPSIFHWLPKWVTGISRMEKRRDHMYQYMKSVIDEHRKTLDVNEPRDLVDCFLIERQRLREAGDKDEEIYEDDMIAWTLSDLFGAGAETTSTTLRWFVLYMIEHPEIQDKIRKEIDAVVGRDRLPTWEDKTKMPFTEATIWEIWRHVTILPIGLDRMATSNTTVGGYDIPKGTLLVTLLYAMHHDPAIFESPSVFRPERFLSPSGELEKNPKIMPFQAGKRQCLGENLARMNTFLGVAYLFQQFEFSKVPGEVYDLTPKPWSEVIHAPRPYKLRAIRRKFT